MAEKRLYEGMFLFDANLASRDWPGLENHVQDLLAKHDAELVYSERWPDRKLAYEIRGCKKGTYYLTYFRAPPGAIPGLRRDSELSERILRLLVLYDEELPNDCEKRIRKEISGSPEEIEAEWDRRVRAAADLVAAEAAVALAIFLNFYNNFSTIDVERASNLKG
ncbi:MAG: 30S ribosomal protein S6 [Planctomycetota bacterium]